MPSPREGILDSKDWDEIKPDFDQDWTLANKGWKPYWKPASSASRFKRAVSRLTGFFWPEASAPPPEKLRPTAWLDGLRGFAAFLVYWHHHTLWVHEMTHENSIFENGFGYDGKYHMIAFHGIRNFIAGGHYAVAIFFVISGYVLSYKPVSLIQAGEYIKLGDNLASALFRRWIRLFLPLIISILIYATMWHAFGIWIHGIEQKGSWWDEMKAFYIEFKQFSFVFKDGGAPWLSYNFHLWTIPFEFKGSIVIYTSLMALSRCSRNARLLAEAGLIYYFMYITDGWYCAIFVGGMMLCELDQLAKKDELPRFLARLSPAKTFIYYHLLALSMFLGGVPCENNKVEQMAKSRGWYYLSYLKPQAVFDYKWFYLFWAAIFMVASVPRIHWLKRFFETRFCQYLGRIAFALYMVHGPVLWTLGDRLYVATGAWHTEDRLEHLAHWANKIPLPKTGPLGMEVAFLVPHIILLPLTLCLAELATRCIDTPSVKFAAWFYRRMLGDPTVKQAKA